MLHIVHTELQDEEFQEADILWPDAAEIKESPRLYFSQIGFDHDDDDPSGEHQAPLKPQVRQKAASSPIDIPGRKVVGAAAPKGTGAPAGSSKFSASYTRGGGAGSAVIGSHVFVPPHIIIDRRAKREKAMLMLIMPSGGRARARKMRE